MFSAVSVGLIVGALLFAAPCPAYSASLDDRLLGDMAGVRTALEESGVDLTMKYTGNVWSNVSGGIKRGTVYLDNLDIILDVDGEKAYGLEGSSARIYFLNNNGGNINSYSGNIEGVDNIDTFPYPSAFRLYELWLQQEFMAGKISALAGLYDLNSEFFHSEMAANFLKPTAEVSQEIAQTGQNGPSIFPVTSLGARLKIRPTQSSYLQVAVVDGEPGNADRPQNTTIDFEDDDGVLSVVELGYIPNASEEGAMNKLAVGLWRYSKPFDDLIDVDDEGNPRKSASQGVYGIASYRFFETKNGEHIGAFVRGGIGDGDIGQTKWSYASGIVAGGWVPARPEGEFGFLATQSYNGDKYMAAQAANATPADRNEYGFELYYRDMLTPYMSIQPDMQYIINPGIRPNLDNAFLLGLRSGIVF